MLIHVVWLSHDLGVSPWGLYFVQVSDFWREKLESMSASMTPENEGVSAEQGGGGGEGGGGGSVKVGQGEGEREDEEVKDGDQKDRDQKDEGGNVEGEEGEKDEPRQKDSNLSSEVSNQP